MNYTFTKVGIMVAAGAVWVFSQQATGEARHLFNLLLLTLLVSMVLINWNQIGPLFFKPQGG